MPVSDSDFAMILASYDALRQKNRREQDARIQTVYRNIPRIREIDREIETFGFHAMQQYLQKKGDPKSLVTDIRSHVESLRAEKRLLLQEGGFNEDYMELHYECPICRDTGFVDNKRCRCLTQKLIETAYDYSNLSDMLSRENFETFDLSRFSDIIDPAFGLSPRQALARIRQEILLDLKDITEGKPANMLFFGPTGTGKTFLCNCIAKHLLDQGKTVLYLSAYDFTDQMGNYRFRRDENPEVVDRVTFIETCDLLIIDDLGTEASNNVTVSDLFNIVNKRLQNNLSTLISTNLNTQQLTRVYSPRLTSRIYGNYHTFQFFGQDQRIQNRR